MNLLQMIEAAGARADAIPGIVKEIFQHIEDRLAAIETRAGDLANYVNPVPRVGGALPAASAKLKSAARAAAAALEEAIADDNATATPAATEAAPTTQAPTT